LLIPRQSIDMPDNEIAKALPGAVPDSDTRIPTGTGDPEVAGLEADISGWFWMVSRLVYSSLTNSGGGLRLILAPELVSKCESNYRCCR
jgi:hypothetical protein